MPFLKIERKRLILQKCALNLEIFTLFKSTCGLNSYLKCNFRNILEKKTFVHETFIEVPLFQETSPAPKSSWLRACLTKLHKKDILLSFV